MTVYSNSAVTRILDPDAATLPQAVTRPLDTAQEARVVFELIIEPIVLGREAY